jgi:hypothetical protein
MVELAGADRGSSAEVGIHRLDVLLTNGCQPLVDVDT